MRLILLGPPGCGKGTQAKLLHQRCHLEHIGTGDILREAARQRTPAGLRAESFMKDGRLVPDDLVNDVIAERFQRADRPERFVMDGYPRTLAQAAAFDRVLRKHHLNLTAVILLRLDDEEIVRRARNRWSCPKAGCMATYNTESNPPRVQGVCDNDGTPLIQREDDKEETVRRRLLVYHGNTEPLVGHYRAQGLLHEVAGDDAIETVYANILKVLKQQAGPTC